MIKKKKLSSLTTILTIISTILTLIIYQQNKKKNNLLLFNKQELIIKEIKEQINHIDVDHNNIINNEQKRLQSCQTLIDKINSYHEEKIIYQSLLSWQKELINKQKLIKYYHQSWISKLIVIIFSIIIMLIIFITKMAMDNIDDDKIDNIDNKNTIKINEYWSYFSLICCLLFYFLNNLFNNNNERLFNTINYFFRYRYISQKTLNHYLFVDEKQVGSFLYDHSMYLLHNQQRYYYVPLIFDHTCNWFLSFFNIIYLLFLIITIIFFHYLFIFKIKKLKKIFINDINNEMEINNINFRNKIFTYHYQFKILYQRYFKVVKKLKNKKIIINQTYDDINNDEEIMESFTFNLLKEKIIAEYSDHNHIFFIIMVFFLTSISFDYASIFFHYKNNQLNLITVIFYWQHCFHELIKNVLKSLPIIKNHYFIQPSLCKFWYPMVLFLIHSSLISIYLFLFGLIYQKPMLFFKNNNFIDQIINSINNDDEISISEFTTFDQFYNHLGRRKILSRILSIIK